MSKVLRNTNQTYQIMKKDFIFIFIFQGVSVSRQPSVSSQEPSVVILLVVRCCMMWASLWLVVCGRTTHGEWLARF
jgi:hypothetical protein